MKIIYKLIRNLMMVIFDPIYRFISDEFYLLKHKYKRIMGRELNLDLPLTYNEKLNWMKLYDRNPLYTKLADKFEARKYVEERIGDEYLIPMIGVWNKESDSAFDNHPEPFVLKCTHDSGSVVICKDK